MAPAQRRRTAHDAFVRYVFSRPEAVAIVLRRVLPPALLPHVDFPSLHRAPTTHSDPNLDTRHADLRFIVDILDDAGRTPIHLAIEHQSTLDPRLPLRAHAYVGDIWSRHVKDRPGAPLPFVLPILLTQHPARDTPCRLSSILATSPILRRTLGAPIELTLLVDDFSGSVLDDHVALPVTRALVEIARAFLHAYDNPERLPPSRIAVLAKQFDILLTQSDPGRRIDSEDDVRALWNYAIMTFDASSPLRGMLVNTVNEVAREMYITIEDELLARGKTAGRLLGKAEGRLLGKAEGRLLGKAEGRLLGKAEALLDVLELRELTIPAFVRERVLATRNEAQLRGWLGRAFTITTAEELFEA